MAGEAVLTKSLHKYIGFLGGIKSCQFCDTASTLGHLDGKYTQPGFQVWLNTEGVTDVCDGTCISCLDAGCGTLDVVAEIFWSAVIALSRTHAEAAAFLGRSHPALAAQRAVGEVPEEAGVGFDEHVVQEGEVLAELERLDAIENDRTLGLGVGCQLRVQEEAVPAEPRGEPVDGRWRDPEIPGDLPVGGSVDDAAGDRDGQFGTFEVVAHRERLLGEAAAAGPADEPGDDPAIAAPLVRRAQAAVTEGRRLDPVLRTVGTWAERR